MAALAGLGGCTELLLHCRLVTPGGDLGELGRLLSQCLVLVLEFLEIEPDLLAGIALVVDRVLGEGGHQLQLSGGGKILGVAGKNGGIERGLALHHVPHGGDIPGEDVHHRLPVVNGLFFIGILVLLRALLSLPFSCYSTFVIEEKFGFNRTTLKTFVIDLVKGFVLAILLGVPIMALVLGFFEHAGPFAWLYCWGAVTLFTLVVQFLAPTLIMPLFNKYSPLEEGELRSAIMEYARSIDFPLQNIFVMDGSKRSTKSNAFFTGFGRNKRIVLFDTLIEQHTVEELVAVLAHEMGHYKKKHILKSILLGIAQTGLLFFLVSIFISYQGLFDAFHMQQTSVYAGLLFFGLLYTPVDFFIGLILQMISRHHERAADQFAINTTDTPEAMIDALKKLSVNNLSNLRPHPIYVFLNYSHPPVLERIRAIRLNQSRDTGYAHA